MSLKPDYLEHRKRIRSRFIKSNGKGMSDYEFLELLLTYAIPRKDVKPIAKQLLSSFGSFSGVLDADKKDLKQINGVGEVSSVLILLVKKLMELYLEDVLFDRNVLSSPKMVVDFARLKISGSKDELFLCIFLNTKNEVIDYEIVQEGTIDQVILYPRKLIERAIIHKASGIILIHNHPSGHAEPSSEDKILTNEIISSAKLFDLRVLDHIIVSKGGYFSFKENNLI
jgi:DNA repair protein RadC